VNQTTFTPVISYTGLIAQVLVEAVPYVQRFKGERVVIKIGGQNLTDPVIAENLTADIFMLHALGMRPVVVHGGGPQINEWMGRLGLAPVFNNGHRVTDAQTLDLVRMVLVGKINREIVAGINRHAAISLGMSGEDGALLEVKRRHPDLGFVGDVTSVNASLIERLLAEDLLPVIATIGVDAHGQAYNINADLGASSIAVALGARKVIYLTDVDGILRHAGEPHTLISETSGADLRAMLTEGAIHEGMIPKVEGCIEAIEGGVGSAHVINGATPHALLIELLTDRGVGTMVTK
jgi:acetylglutamate kinase